MSRFFSRAGRRTAPCTSFRIKETLAAAVLLLGGADPELPFVDPVAGSGTLAIEQALRARRIAPGLSRAFGFQRWPAYRGGPQSAWDRMKEEARALALPRAPAPIVARDLHPKAVLAARRNAAAAGVAEDVLVEQGDARDLEPRFAAGTLAANPPYGERLMGSPGEAPPRDARVQEKKLAGFYRGLAEMLLRHHGWTALLLSGNPLLPRALPLRPEIDHRLWNGPLEAHLLRYRLP
jgi:putative N6-adenine-specific DNA methylase